MTCTDDHTHCYNRVVHYCSCHHYYKPQHMFQCLHQVLDILYGLEYVYTQTWSSDVSVTYIINIVILYRPLLSIIFIGSPTFNIIITWIIYRAVLKAITQELMCTRLVLFMHLLDHIIIRLLINML